MNLGKSWTADDDARLKELAGTMSIERIARAMHRAESTLIKHSVRLDVDLEFKSDWTPKEIEALKRVVDAGGTRVDAAIATGRTVSAVRNKSRGLGLRFLRGRRACHCDWKPEQIDALRRVVAAGGEPRDAETATGRSAKACHTKALRLGLHFKHVGLVQKAVRRDDPDGPAPRERKGLARGPKTVRITGTVSWCPRCHAPVVDTPQAWAEHRQRVHIQPIRRIA